MSSDGPVALGVVVVGDQEPLEFVPYRRARGVGHVGVEPLISLGAVSQPGP